MRFVHCQAGAWFGSGYADEKVPTLKEICDLLHECETHASARLNPREVNLYVDCKDVDAKQLADALREYGKLDGAVYYGSPEFLLELRRYAPNAKLMPPLKKLEELDARIERVNPYAFDTRWSSLSEELISQAHKKGVKIYSDAMGEHETIEDYREAIQWGIDTIQTDRIPRVLRAIELDMLY